MATQKSIFRTLPWKLCVANCTGDLLDNFASWRSFSQDFVNWLVAQSLLGFYPVSGNIKYPCLPVYDARGNFLGEHIFTGRRGNMKALYTDGAKPMPLVVGSPKLGAEWEFFEGQWDAFSVADATGWYQDTSIVFATTRGAGNAETCRGLVPNGAKVYLWPQNDDPATRIKGKTPAESWTIKMADLYPGALIAPLTESVHDHNDALRTGFKNFAVCRDMAFPIGAIANLGYNQTDTLEMLDIPQIEKDLPTEIIKGILYRGGKMLIAGGSKTYKSWALIDLTLAISNGFDFWSFPTFKGRVLYLNLELQPALCRQRFEKVAALRNASLEGIKIINLRGKRISQKLFRQLEKQIAAGDFVLIVLDPAYKLLAGRDEIHSGDITEFLNRCEDLAQAVGAAIALSHHFSKGNQAAKDAIDRPSGSGVWARDPDALFPLTAHEEKDCYVIEPVLRDFAPLSPFAVRWEHPVFNRDPSLDPANLKARSGPGPKYTVKDLLDHITVLDELPTRKFFIRVRHETNMSESTFFRLLKQAQKKGLLIQESISKLWKLPPKKP